MCINIHYEIFLKEKDNSTTDRPDIPRVREMKWEQIRGEMRKVYTKSTAISVRRECSQCF